ncbi:MAG: nucleotidyltransferase domain-containing protein [Candidatus Lokiarchaeota archaeon]|nr:nucleotidyltransferase domain-containing protein [Candidatus Lokiarchaeota archaeon]
MLLKILPSNLIGVIDTYTIMIQKLRLLKKKHLKELKQELRRVVSELINLGAIKIIQFGSSVREELSLTSDIDLIVIIKTDQNFLERSAEIYKKVKPKDVDLLIYTPIEFKRMKEENLFIQHVLKEGKVFYERNK